ncbi:MAG: DnaA N-terminal domain-containing protein [Arenibacterium sp.]
MEQDRAGSFGPKRRAVGAGASAFKYDVLSALLVMAAQGDPVVARLSLRLSLLITARFNWRRGVFAVGQKELARMWGVTERTAKREMAALRARGWIVLRLASARGRVAQYEIDFDTVLRETVPFWSSIGSDFVARLSDTPEPVAPASNVVPLRPVAITPEPDDNGWGQAAAQLQAQDPAVFNAWFAGLQALDVTSGVLTLAAPSRFVADYVRTHFLSRLLVAVVAVNRGVRDVQVVVAE